ncbi:MAG TPA: WD40 repeat domain-containing protein [Opitutaceae bacterium]|nr:WD40 repeat domain-containing protein [Opitutaceae bacterium]
MNLIKHWAGQLDDYVIDLAWSPDGDRLAAASGAGPVMVFSAASGATASPLPGHEGGTNCLAWMPVVPAAAAGSPPSETAGGLPPPASVIFASGGQDGAVKFWDAATGQHTGTAALGKSWVEQLAWRPLSQKSEVRNQKSEEISVPPHASSDVRSLPSDLCLAAAAGRQFTLLNADASVRHTFPPAPKTISALAWHPQGGAVAVAYFGGVCLWDAGTFAAQKEFAYGNGIHALVWSPDGKWLVSGNQDPSVHLWLPAEDQEFHMSGYEGKVKHLSFDHSSHWLATSGGREVCTWDCSGEGPEGRDPTMLPHDAPVCAVAFQRRHGLLAAASEDGALQLWSPERKQPLRATMRLPAPATRLGWSPDDRLLAIGTESGAVFVLRCEL